MKRFPIKRIPMNRLWLKRGLAALGLYLFFLLWLLPAAQLHSWFAPSLKQAGIELAGVEGTLWEGASERVSLNGTELGRLRWELSALALLTLAASAELEIQTDKGFVKCDLRATPWGTLSLSDIDGRMPVGWFTQFAPFMPVVVDGIVSLELEELLIEKGILNGALGRAVWHQAAVTVPQAMAFGDLELELSEGEGGAVVGKLRDRGGALSLDGNLNLVEGRFQLEGSVAPGKEAPPTLGRSLGILGRPDKDGRYPLNFSGTL